jgi:hypothetical protein
MRGVADEQIGVTVDCRSESHLIVAGLQEHRSQHHVIIDDPADTERYHLARVNVRGKHLVDQTGPTPAAARVLPIYVTPRLRAPWRH